MKRDFNYLMAWSRKYAGCYFTNIDGIEYTVEKNPVSNDWHLYVNGDWSTDVDSLKHGKLIAISKAFKL
jgi:hypothetical protein